MPTVTVTISSSDGRSASHEEWCSELLPAVWPLNVAARRAYRLALIGLAQLHDGTKEQQARSIGMTRDGLNQLVRRSR